MSEFRMPSLGADMDAGTLVGWKVKPGDEVHRGDIVADVETQKGVIEVEVFEDGVVDQLLISEGAKVPVGTVLAYLHKPGEAPPPLVERPTPAPGTVTAAEAPPPPYLERPTPAPEPIAPSVAVPAAEAPPAAEGPAPAAPHRVRSSPAARKRAEVLGVDLAHVQGTGPSGAITAQDVERAAKAKIPSPPGGAEAMREAIAAAMSRSKREIPHYYLSTHLDVGRALDWLERTNRERPVTERVLPVVLFLKAVARAARELPQLNGHFVEGHFRPSSAVHLGVAISLRGGGLIAPAIHDVIDKPVELLMRELTDLIRRTRAGTLRHSELMDPTLTVTHLAEPGVEAVFGVIHPPQVAIVGFGQVTPTPVAIDGAIGVRPIVTATLSGDHRVSDGHDGGRFIAAVDRWLHDPEAL